MPGLPPSALTVLDTASERFSEKPIRGELVYKLEPMHVRRAMATAGRAAGPGQSPAVVYNPGHGDALIVLRASDLAALLSNLHRNTDSPL
jgi:hypothetical protein